MSNFHKFKYIEKDNKCELIQLDGRDIKCTSFTVDSDHEELTQITLTLWCSDMEIDIDGEIKPRSKSKKN